MVDERSPDTLFGLPIVYGDFPGFEEVERKFGHHCPHCMAELMGFQMVSVEKPRHFVVTCRGPAAEHTWREVE